MIDIELDRVPDLGNSDVVWTARWRLRGSPSTEEGHDEELADLIQTITHDLGPLSEFYTLTLTWQLGDTAPAGHTVAEAVAATGLTLPTRLPGQT